MSDCLEVLFASDSSEKSHTVTCFNPHIGTTLMTYRGCATAAKNCLSLIGKDYLLSAEEGKPILHTWALNSPDPSTDLKIITPGKLSALATSPDGNYCLGAIDAKIYVWQISSGSLLNLITKHYQRINKIAFTDDSSHFVTAGQDGMVLVWKLAEAVSKQCGSFFTAPKAPCTPLHTFTHHSLPVVDIFLGHGALKARLFTASIDQTCKVFCLTTGTLLLSLMFNHVLTAITVNELETALFAGTNSGNIYTLDLDPYPRSLEHIVSEESEALGLLTGHSAEVSCLGTSFDGVTLASGSCDSKVYLWNVPGRQLLRSFDLKGPVTNLFFSIASDSIFTQRFTPSVVVRKLEKVSSFDEKDLELSVWVREELKPICLEVAVGVEERREEGGEERGEEERDVEGLKRQILKLKEANKELYQFAVNKILKNPFGVGDDQTRTEIN